MKRAIVAIAAVLGAAAVCRGRIITVDDDGPADFNNIQAAIDDANDGDTVLVADGTYTGNGNRDIDFRGKAITVKSENGPENCIIDCNGTLSDLHRGFYFHSGEDANSAIIGFTITKGWSPSVCLPYPPFTCSLLGGGIRCDRSSPTISDCRITGNWAYWGGGIYSRDGGSPIVTHCAITGNYALSHGGGMCAGGGSRISYCTFSDNVNVAGAGGGGIYTWDPNLEVTNCTFVGNSGGAFYYVVDGWEGTPMLTNCILWGNGPEIYIRIRSGSGSVLARYCDIKGGWPGQGNIDADPCFADLNSGDYHLKSKGGRWEPNSQTWIIDDVTSPCIDAGDPMFPIGYEPFPNGGRINIGAYGGTAQASKSFFGAAPCETIIAGDVNGDCRIDFYDFAILASHWLERPFDPGCCGIAITDVKIYRCEFIEGRFVQQEEIKEVTVGEAFKIQVEVTNTTNAIIETDNFYGWDMLPVDFVEVIGEPVVCATWHYLQPGASMWKVPFCSSQAFEAVQPGWVTMNISVLAWHLSAYESVRAEATYLFEIQ